MDVCVYVYDYGFRNKISEGETDEQTKKICGKQTNEKTNYLIHFDYIFAMIIIIIIIIKCHGKCVYVCLLYVIEQQTRIKN